MQIQRLGNTGKNLLPDWAKQCCWNGNDGTIWLAAANFADNARACCGKCLRKDAHMNSYNMPVAGAQEILPTVHASKQQAIHVQHKPWSWVAASL